MRLIVGLGNPDQKYKNNRHNVGFILLDEIVFKKGLKFEVDHRFQGLVAKGRDTIYLKPLTYMNDSGESVSKISNYFKIIPGDILVVHDDVDLEPFDIRKKLGSGAAGHHGIESIIEHLGTQNFWRIRVGVGRPTDEKGVADYVLEDFSEEELSKLKEVDLPIS